MLSDHFLWVIDSFISKIVIFWGLRVSGHLKTSKPYFIDILRFDNEIVRGLSAVLKSRLSTFYFDDIKHYQKHIDS